MSTNVANGESGAGTVPSGVRRATSQPSLGPVRTFVLKVLTFDPPAFAAAACSLLLGVVIAWHESLPQPLPTLSKQLGDP